MNDESSFILATTQLLIMDLQMDTRCNRFSPFASVSLHPTVSIFISKVRTIIIGDANSSALLTETGLVSKI